MAYYFVGVYIIMQVMISVFAEVIYTNIKFWHRFHYVV